MSEESASKEKVYQLRISDFQAVHGIIPVKKGAHRDERAEMLSIITHRKALSMAYLLPSSYFPEEEL